MKDDEAHDLAKVMMSRKASRLYGRMQKGIAKKKENVDLLYKRRREIDREKEKGPGGKTMLKQQVERLKEERKDVLKAYSDPGGSMKKSKKKKKKQQQD